MALRVVKLVLAYDGVGFAGYAAQRSKRTVQGELESALGKLIPHGFKTRVAGRTDAGVHAFGQVVSVHFALDGAELSAEKIALRLNKMLGGEIAVLDASETDASFGARRSAISRSYRYRVLLSEVADPIRRNNVWHTGPLDVARLEASASLLIGSHDFRAYCKKPAPAADTTRQVLSAEWRRPDGEGVQDEIWFEITANAFCHQMIRRIVGRSVAVANGRHQLFPPEEIESLGASPAPPHALYLVSVAY